MRFIIRGDEYGAPLRLLIAEKSVPQTLLQSYAVQVVARLCAFSILFNLLGAARHEPV